MTDLVESKYFLLIFKINQIHVNFIHNKVAAIMSCILKHTSNAKLNRTFNITYIV